MKVPLELVLFPILEVPSGAADMFEQLGTKEKFWYEDVHLGLSLFKFGRPNTGENWAEKLACELAGLLGLPRAYYELGAYEGRYGVISPSFVPEHARLVHGNEILIKANVYPTDEGRRFYRSRAHTITVVLAFMKSVSVEQSPVFPPTGFVEFEGVKTAGDVFAGYLMLDAWIGNQDRHDENWGLIADPNDGRVYLAPSFDHGSSLARNETDEACREMLITRDTGRHISAYVRRARSAVYPHGADGRTRALSTVDAFGYALRQFPAPSRAWLARLDAITEQQIRDLVAFLPDAFVSEQRREFVVSYLNLNRGRLLSLLAQ